MPSPVRAGSASSAPGADRGQATDRARAVGTRQGVVGEVKERPAATEGRPDTPSPACRVHRRPLVALVRLHYRGSLLGRHPRIRLLARCPRGRVPVTATGTRPRGRPSGARPCPPPPRLPYLTGAIVQTAGMATPDSRYGPHRVEDAPSTVTIRPRGLYAVEVQAPLPHSLVRQRVLINTIAHHGRVSRGMCRTCSLDEWDCLSTRPGMDDDHGFEPPAR